MRTPFSQWAMRTRLLMLTAVVVGLAQHAFAAPVYTNKTEFRIPYRFDPEEMRRIGAQEIRLYESRDQGRSWQLAKAVDPKMGRFDYQATRDGEFWFAVRTLDGRNQLYPAGGITEPGLQVVIDTAKPDLTVNLQGTPGGRVQLSWQADDTNLDASTLKLEFLQTGTIQWETVRVQPAAAGQTSWTAPDRGFVTVRGSIADRAGNLQQVEKQIRLDVPVQPVIRPPRNRQEPDGPIATQPGNNLVMSPPSGNWDSPKTDLISSSTASRPDILQNPYTTEGKPPRVTKHTRVVNTRQFNIDYELEDVGPSGVGAVELFITENDGGQWFRYGADPDAKSPFVVETPSDGIYGFAVRVKSGTGLSSPPPQVGEKPSMVVVVDQTAPEVKLIGAEQGSGSNLMKVRVMWETSDNHPADRPVALSYATDPNGIWEPISGWTENTGEYVWSLAPNTPTRVYLRVTARDSAGNLSKAESEQPLLIDLSRPSARLINVEAAGR
ncbi:fibronectin type III domain-containing protein [Thalassoroseus pseudoceratinae]|uniref:hypothetical protein n=1 Tax=Thalassoroseus pseudoceratinae TaxID=2713176 RepID=UPI00141F8764|nr:hypothetical protein [Thalassoroseus pseudoceratinae]